jgi:alkylation response protein AidB-like acyl-CoA dehydrogenase
VWPFVTGCQDAAWYYLNCVVVQGRTVQLNLAGIPQTRMVAVPAGTGEILDTWHALGLRGTGSHDVRLAGVPVDPEFTFTVDPADPASGAVLHRIAAASLVIAACVVGIAQGAMADIQQLAAGGRRPAFSPTRLAASPVFHDALGEAYAGVRAARALLYAEAAAAQGGTGQDGTGQGGIEQDGPGKRAALRAATSRIVGLAAAAVDTAYLWAGGSAVFDDSPLQRRWRDTRTATQHVVAGRGSYPVLGALLVGEPASPGAV